MEQPRPLHRLTPLRDDPAASWLRWTERLQAAFMGAMVWVVYGVALELVYVGYLFVLFHYPGAIRYGYAFHGGNRLVGYGLAALTAALIWPLRRLSLRVKSRQIAKLARVRAPAEAIAVDDWDQLAAQPDGAAISLVGWVRGREHLPHPVGGERCVGLAVPCQKNYPGVMESVHDFDLVDEQGRTLTIQVADGRLLGPSNVTLSPGENPDRLLLGSLDLPTGAVLSSWNALALREGDPVLVVGFKAMHVDVMGFGLRQAPILPALGSAPPRPLMIFPLPATERRPS
jgi:hypothetical protein